MSKLSTAYKLFTANRGLFIASMIQTYGKWLPDETYIKLVYRFKMGHKLDLKNPKTFTEKIQWLKLFNRKPQYTKMVDKYAVKQYVADSVGDEYIIPTLGVWDNFDDINFDILPDQFVLKTTHGGGGGGVVICKDKATLNKKKTKEIIEHSMKGDIYKNLREWPYKNVVKRIIAEKYMAPEKSPKHSDLVDYKFFCFNGKPMYCQVIRDRHSKETIDFYDMEWNHQEFVGLNPVAHNGKCPVDRPVHLEEMINICTKLAKNIPFLRVDLYVIDDKAYFGELTFFPASGIGIFAPEKWNEKLGELISLPVEDSF